MFVWKLCIGGSVAAGDIMRGFFRSHTHTPAQDVNFAFYRSFRIVEIV